MSCCSTGIIRNWPNELQAPEMPNAHERFSTGAMRPMMPLTAPNAVHARASPINTPEPSTNRVASVVSAIHTSPSM